MNPENRRARVGVPADEGLDPRLSASRFRILHVLAAPYPTCQGTQVYVRGMIRALARRGHRVALACYAHAEDRIPPDPGVELIRTPAVPGYRNLRAGPDAVKPLLDVALAWRVAQHARRFQLIHAHNYEAPLAGYLARSLTGVPVLYHQHTTLEEELPVYFRHRPVRILARVGGRWLDGRIPPAADAALAISPRGERILRDLGCSSVFRIAPGVALEDLQGPCPERARRRWGLGSGRWVVYAGNPDPYQDLPVLVKAVATLPEANLLVVSASSLRPLARACLQAGIPRRRLRMVTTSSWRLTRDLVAAAHVAALPRTLCSGFPVKVLDYLGLGVPVVAAEGAVGPMPGVVRVPNGDVPALAGALWKLLRDPSARGRLARAGGDAVWEHRSWERRVLYLEALYRRLLTEPATAGAGGRC